MSKQEQQNPAITILGEALRTARNEMDDILANLSARVDGELVRTLVVVTADRDGNMRVQGVTVMGLSEVLGCLSFGEARINAELNKVVLDD